MWATQFVADWDTAMQARLESFIKTARDLFCLSGFILPRLEIIFILFQDLPSSGLAKPAEALQRMVEKSRAESNGKTFRT
jgi:hypothetical protein